MCGRFALAYIPQPLVDLYGQPPFSVQARYNIAPTQLAVVVAHPKGKQPVFLQFRWGLIPSWAKSKAVGVRAINARAETVDVKPTFRDAFSSRRCLIPATGFYEWQRSPGDNAKTPHYFAASDDSAPLAFAGLWDKWDGDGETVYSCAVVTTGANDLMAPIHHRMPIVLEPKDWSSWIDPDNRDAEFLKSLLMPPDNDAMNRRRVGSLVNNPRHEGKECIEPAE